MSLPAGSRDSFLYHLMPPRTFSPASLLALSLSLSLSFAKEPKMATIWTVSDEDSTVYLAGSVHLLREKDMPVPSGFDKAYAESEELVFEIDMAAMSDPGMAQEMRKLGSLPEGESLGDKFDPKTMKRLRSYLTKRKMAVEVFDSMTPGMVYLMIGSLEAARIGAKPELGLETRYYEKSVEDGKPSKGLETAAFQMSRFNEFDLEMIQQLINEALDEVDQGKDTLSTIIAAWRSGNEKALSELIVEQTAPSPKLHEVLLTDRNKSWIPEVEKHLATDRDVMFLVGAAHLVGEDSVVDLMREKGYQVLQLANGE